MKDDALSRALCGVYCQYYKPSKEEDLACMGFIIAERLLQQGFPIPFAALSEQPVKKDDPEMPAADIREMLLNRVCTICPFYENDCDFSAVHKPGASGFPQVRAIPCGGFLFLGLLIDKKIIDSKDIKQVM